MSPVIDAPTRPHGGALGRSIDRWVESGLITREQGEAIRRAEAARAPEPAVRRRVPLIAEVLGYLGAALAVAAVGSLLGQHWDDRGTAAHIAVTASGVAALWLGGWLLRDTDEPALERLAGALWLLSVGAMGALVAVIGVDVWKPSPEAVATAAGASCFLYAAALWAWRRRAPQLVALAAAGVTLTASAAVFAGASPDGTALAVWVFGLAWFAAAWAGALRPEPAAYVLGALPILIAPWVAAEADAMSFLGLAGAAGLMAVSVKLRETPLLVLGSIGVFGFITEIVARYFADTIGVPLALLLSGVILIGVALVTARLYRLHPRDDEPG
jgi:hypothetical protein